ncbi:MAG: TIGR02466 family protein [Woeseiaceae bacterium]|nr:TIGR02466 family protein [Woeseiaceae bacterium]
MAGEQSSGEKQTGLSMIFGTPFVSYQWPESDELNAELAALVLEAEAKDDQGRGIRSNAGGWQSRGNIMTWQQPAVQRLKKRIEQLIFNLIGELVLKDGRERSFTLLSEGWANVCRPGNYNVVHTHPNAMWSVVYYVSAGKPDPSVPYSGALELLDPRESANYIQIQNTVLDARTFIENKPGRMVVFPSWVKHMVHPFVGEGVRISIAVNVNVVENHPQKP